MAVVVSEMEIQGDKGLNCCKAGMKTLTPNICINRQAPKAIYTSLARIAFSEESASFTFICNKSFSPDNIRTPIHTKILF